MRRGIPAANQERNDMTESNTLSAGEPMGEDLVITRIFDAPRELLFRAWTEPERLARWWGPKGFMMLSCTFDLRPDGIFHYGMRSPDGREMWGRWQFREIVEPERLVFVTSFADADGNPVRAPFSSEWPLEVLSTLTFAEQEGRTTLTLHGIPISATETERMAFEAAREGMQTGWSGTLHQLDEYLAEARS